MGGMRKIDTGSVQGALLPGDDRDLDLDTIRKDRGEDEISDASLELENSDPTLPLAIEGMGDVAVNGESLLFQAFPGSEFVES